MRDIPNIIYCEQSKIENMARNFPEKGLLFVSGMNPKNIMSLVEIFQSVRPDAVIVLQNNLEYAKKISQEKLVFFLYEEDVRNSHTLHKVKEIQELLFAENDTRESHTDWIRDNFIGNIKIVNLNTRRYVDNGKTRILLENIFFYKKCYLDIPISKKDYTTWEVENPHSLLRLSSVLYSKIEKDIVDFYTGYLIDRPKEDVDRINNTLWVSSENIMKLDNILPEKGIVISYGLGNMSGNSYALSLLRKNNPERFVTYVSLESVLDVDKFIKEASEKLVILGVRFQHASKERTKRDVKGSVYQNELDAYFNANFVKPEIITDQKAYEKAFTDNLWGSIEHSIEQIDDNTYKHFAVVKKAKVNGDLSKKTNATNLSYEDVITFEGENNA